MDKKIIAEVDKAKKFLSTYCPQGKEKSAQTHFAILEKIIAGLEGNSAPEAVSFKSTISY
jgi:hypothetical protein